MDEADRTLVAALPESAWQVAADSGKTGRPLEIAALPNGKFALRGGSTPDTLIFTKSELAAFLRGAQAGEFDDMT